MMIIHHDVVVMMIVMIMVMTLMIVMIMTIIIVMVIMVITMRANRLWEVSLKVLSDDNTAGSTLEEVPLWSPNMEEYIAWMGSLNSRIHW